MKSTDDQSSVLFDNFQEDSTGNALKHALGMEEIDPSSDSGADTKVNKKPKMWARVVGVIGELLICAGVVLGLFILWQTWWTNLEVSDEQDQAVEKVQKEFGEIPQEKIGSPQKGEPPAASSISHGGLIGLMHIPALGDKQSTPIHEGETLDVLNKGVFAHYADTAMPGEIGNFSTAIHRDTYGARVLHIDDLRVGDPIIVETENAWLVYKFTDYEIVKPTDIYVVSADPYAAKAAADPNSAVTEPSGRYLTITTCHPPLVSSDRWVVHAKFDHWVARADGLPQELAGTADDQPKHTAEKTGTSIREALGDGFAGIQEIVAPKED